MRIETNSGMVEAVGLGEGKRFSMDATPAAFALLSSGLYTNKIRAVLREVGCNAVDAHKLNGQQALPIEVKIPNRLDSSFFIRDFGPGLSHDDILSLYTTYFKSSKAKDDTMIGGFGVGSKSPFAYTDTFTVISIHNGEKRIYSAFIGNEGIPEIHQMGDTMPTDEPSGLQIGFPVKPSDVVTFEKEAQDVFSAFPVRPKILGVTLDFKKYETEQWVENIYQYKSNNSASTWNRVRHDFSINMGGVRYPLYEFSEKAQQANKPLSPMADALLKQPLELRIDIGQLSVAASREALQYDARTLDNLTTILNTAADKLVEMLVKKIESVYDPKKSIPVNAKAFRAVLDKNDLGYDDWKSFPWATHPLLKDRPDILSVFHAAVSGNYVIDLKKYPHIQAVTITNPGYQAYQKLSQNYDINTYKERRKMIVALRRQIQDDRTKVVNTITRPMNDDAPLLSIAGSYSPEMLLSAYNSGKLNSWNSNLVLMPKHGYETKRGIELPVEPTAAEIQAFNTDLAALQQEYDLSSDTLSMLTPLAAPPKTKKEKSVWTIPVHRHTSNMDVRKTLRGLPSSGVAEETSEEVDDEVAYLVYDRKAEQLNGGRNLQAHLATARSALRYIDVLNRYGMPTKIVLVAKEHLTDFVDLYPNALEFTGLMESIKKDPKLVHDCTTWTAQRPELASLSHRESKWKYLYDALKDKNKLLKGLLQTTGERWDKLDSSKYDSATDAKMRDFYSEMLNIVIPPLKMISLDKEVDALNMQYPYIQYFEYNTPERIRHEYIQKIDTDVAAAAGLSIDDITIKKSPPTPTLDDDANAKVDP